MGQRNEIYPETFVVFFNNPALTNAAFVHDDGKLHATAGYKFRTGPFKKIANYTFCGDYTLRRQNDAAHVFRITFFNENEGPYIERPRANLNYVYQLPIGEEMSVSAGLSLGGASYYFSAPSATGDGSVLVPDGSAGIGLNLRNTRLSISSFQVFNASSTPIGTPIRFGRYYNATFHGEKMLSAHVDLKADALYRLLPYYTNNLIVAMTCSLDEVLDIGVAVNYPVGISFFSNLHLETEKDRMMLSFAYNSPLLFSHMSIVTSMEITAAFFIK